MPTPAESPFVLDVSAEGVHSNGFDHGDLYRPADDSGPRPTIVFLSGPAPDDVCRWPMFVGYGRLAVRLGVNAVVARLGYERMQDFKEVASRLPAVLDEVRARPEVAADRVALWAFSGGGLLVDEWLAAPPPWLRVVALTYPVFGTPPKAAPGLPIVLTRAELEDPSRLARVDEFAAANEVRLIHAVGGHHSFDLVDHTEESRAAVTTAMTTVCDYLS